MYTHVRNLRRLSAVFLSVCMFVAMILLPSSAGAASPGGTGWSAKATDFRGQNGVRFTYSCPAGGPLGSVWGTDTYTDDSSVCSAAVHKGVISVSAGGAVTIEIRPGLSAYVGSTRHGVTSSSYGSWTGSFVVVVPTRVAPSSSKISLTLLTAVASPGGQQAALVVAAKSAAVAIVIDYPDGRQVVVGPKNAAADGKLVYTWTVPRDVHGAVHVTVVSAAKVAQSSFTVQ